jgi:hypothetical protein
MHASLDACEAGHSPYSPKTLSAFAERTARI